MSLMYKKGDLIQQILHKEQAFLGISDVCRKAAVNHTGQTIRLYWTNPELLLQFLKQQFPFVV